MYLVNAIYFKSSWKEGFNTSNTQPQPFYLPDNSQVKANFMSANIDYNYYNDNGTSIYELPYSNNKFSMVIIEPPAGTPVNTVIGKPGSAR
jgi:serpin B